MTNSLPFFLLMTVNYQALSQSNAVDSTAFDVWIGERYGKDSVKEFGTNRVPNYSIGWSITVSGNAEGDSDRSCL